MRKKITIEVDSDSDNLVLEEQFRNIIKFGFQKDVWKKADIMVEDVCDTRNV